MNEIERLRHSIANANAIVFFGGAGVSTESGIPDFRSDDGLYNQKYKYPPEQMLSHSFFVSNTREFYDFYRDKMLFLDAKPNKAHKALAELERCGKLTSVITQNIDGLHQAAGSKKVIELHGSVHRNYCRLCRELFSIDAILKAEGVPLCECGGIIKPDVVLYEEPLNDEVVSDAIEHISRADMVIVGGTSLVVYPAAGLLNYYKGSKLVLINKSETAYDHRAYLTIRGNVGEVLWDAIM